MTGAHFAATLVAALPLTGPVAAQGLPGALWYDGPGSTTPGDARMRLVFDATRAAALTPEQYWTYSNSYRRNMAALSMRMSVANAVPRARIAALTEVTARYPSLRVNDMSLHRVDGARNAPHF